MIKKNIKKRVVNTFAGVAAVCFSPALSGLIVNNADNISRSVGDTLFVIGEYIEAESAVARENTHKDIPPTQMLLLNNAAVHEPVEQEQAFEPILEEWVVPDLEEADSSAVMAFNMADFKEDISVFSSRDGRIVTKTYGPVGGANFINLEKAGQVRNATGLSNEFVAKTANTKPDIRLEQNGEPEVLIIHTHTGESYYPEGGYYDGRYSNRSNDTAHNVVAVGASISAALAESGISVIHDGTIHDYPVFSGAYARSAVTVSELLRMNPSIKVVLDIHRDAIYDQGEPVAAVAEINGKSAAQIMFISAADNGEYDIPDYLENLKLAAHLQSAIESDNPGLTRPILFQYCHYNQDLSTGSLLIEVGSHGNTLEEAVYAGELIGRSIAKALMAVDG
ncbi:MAG: stage II sporulation protein P [Oscillospiraceae bacterium]|nr:stage II sporulation protein P [Oscillospiraceae bacterium]